MKKSNAFTLIELLITVAIFSILAAIAGPSLILSLQNNAMVTNTNSLVASLQLARSEAIKLRSRVSICPSKTALSAAPECSGTFWETGWVVWNDSNGNNAVDAGEQIIRVNEGASDGDVTIRGDIAAKSVISFVSSGMPQSTSGENFTGTLKICDSRGFSDLGDGSSNARAVVVMASGRIRSTNSRGVIQSCL